MDSRYDASTPPLTVEVECYAGYRGEETPRRFRLGDEEVLIVTILDRWLAPDHRYFKVLDTAGDRYILRHDVATGLWEMTSFSRGGPLPPGRPPASSP